jgi:alpha-ketoglutarate-dependent taurine dioxygenase
MKTRKLTGFGKLGVEVYDFDLKTCSDDDIRELGKIVIDQLVVYVNAENCSVDAARLNHIAQVFGDPFGGQDQSAYKMVEEKRKNRQLSKKDLVTLKELRKIRVGLEDYPGMIRVTGKKDEEGDYIGMFAEGELDWHSDRQGTGNFVPMILLNAVEGTEGTCTEFLQTADAYDALTPEWKTIIDNLVGVHRYIPGKMAPGLNASQDNILRMNMCPIDDSEVPIVCYSPGGRKGIRLSYNTLDHFKGFNKADSDEILKFIMNHFIKDEYVYHQDWKNGELVFMDQTITVHRRPTKDCSKRVMIRQTCNFDNILNKGTQGLQNIGYESPGIIVDGKVLTTQEYFEKFKYAY